jgi:hypothetical protein
VDGESEAGPAAVEVGCEQVKGSVHVVESSGLETALCVAQGAIEAAARIDTEQKGEADPCLTGGAEMSERGRDRVGVGGAIDVAVKVVELADRGVARLEAFDVGQACGALEGDDIERVCKTVHAVSPRPEAVGPSGVATLDLAAKEALESVRVGVRKALEAEVGGRRVRIGRRAD